MYSRGGRVIRGQPRPPTTHSYIKIKFKNTIFCTDHSILIAARNSSDTQEEMHKIIQNNYLDNTIMKCKQPTVILVLVSLDCMNILNCI